MKKNRILLFGMSYVIVFMIISVVAFGVGIGFLWLPFEGAWVMTLVACALVIIGILCLLFGFPSGGYIVKNNDQIEVYPLIGKKRRSYPLSDLYEVSVKKLFGYQLTGEYICLYFCYYLLLQIFLLDMSLYLKHILQFPQYFCYSYYCQLLNFYNYFLIKKLKK